MCPFDSPYQKGFGFIAKVLTAQQRSLPCCAYCKRSVHSGSGKGFSASVLLTINYECFVYQKVMIAWYSRVFLCYWKSFYLDSLVSRIYEPGSNCKQNPLGLGLYPYVFKEMCQFCLWRVRTRYSEPMRKKWPWNYHFPVPLKAKCVPWGWSCGMNVSLRKSAVLSSQAENPGQRRGDHHTQHSYLTNFFIDFPLSVTGKGGIFCSQSFSLFIYPRLKTNWVCELN